MTCAGRGAYGIGRIAAAMLIRGMSTSDRWRYAGRDIHVQGFTLAEAGKRDRVVVIQSLTESKGDSNYPVETWATLTTVWASREPQGGRERFIAEQHSAPFDTRWEIPYSEDWDPSLLNVPKMRRLVYEGRVHDIVAAEEIDRKRGVRVMTLSGGTVV